MDEAGEKKLRGICENGESMEAGASAIRNLQHKLFSVLRGAMMGALKAAPQGAHRGFLTKTMSLPLKLCCGTTLKVSLKDDAGHCGQC